MKHLVTVGDLIRLHHQPYEEDIPFWISRTNNARLILELGCGHGRVTIPLAKEGRIVIGIDRDREALSFLNALISSQGLDLRKRIQIVQADIVSFRSPPIFEAVILPCNTFSTLNHHNRMELLDRVVHSLLPGGSFIASFPNPEGGVIFSESPTDDNDKGELEIESQFLHPDYGFPVQVSSKLMPTEGGMILEWVYDLLLPDGTVERFIKSTQHYLEPLEVYLSEFHKAGLVVVDCLGDFTGGEYNQDSPYLILSGKSP